MFLFKGDSTPAQGAGSDTFGPYADAAALETAKPAASNPGAAAYVGASAPYIRYLSTGSAWHPVPALTGPSDTIGLGIVSIDAAAPGSLTGRNVQWFIGTNIGASGGRADASKTGYRLAIAQRQFSYPIGPAAAGVGFSNFALGCTLADGSDNTFFSFEKCEESGYTADQIGGYSQGYFSANSYNWKADGGVGAPSMMQLIWSSKSLLLNAAGMKIQKQVNNEPIISCVNATGSGSINLLTLDNSDRVRYDAPVYINIPSGKTQTAFDILTSSTAMPNGWIAFQVQGTTFVANASVFAFNAVLSCDGVLKHNLQNNRNATNAGAAQYVQALYGNSGCDTKTVFINNGVGGTAITFAHGVDQSALKYKISKSENLGTSDVFSSDGTTAEFHVPLRLATQTPASASADGVAGTVTWDADYIYVCTATNTWKRVAIATW